MIFNLTAKRVLCYRRIAVLLALLLIASPVVAQQPVESSAATTKQTAKPPDPTFETLLATDAYKLYGEVRNVGQLLSTGGAGEIIEPVIKLADPGQEFKSVVNFLKKNSEALANSRLMFATWPARTDLPTMFMAIEFPTNEDATKFAPSLEKFLPTVLPPVPVNADPSPKAGPGQANTASPETKPKPSNGSVITEETLPFVITRSGNLICISDKPFKFEKLHPVASKSLFQDQSFRMARDKFTPEPVFLFFNVALEDKTKPKPSQKPGISDEEAARRKAEDTDESPDEPPKSDPAMLPSPEAQAKAVLIAGPEPSPAPTPTKEQQAQAVASVQVGQILDMVGIGEPQWPEAVGLAFALEGSEYIAKAVLIDKPGAKLLPIPFVPQLIGGPPYNAEASSVLPDDTEMFVSASIDLTQTYEGMRKQAELRAKNNTAYKGVQTQPAADAEPDVFTQFEKRAGFKFKDDLLPALGSEIAIAGSIKTLEAAGGFRFGVPTAAKSSTDPNDPNKKDSNVVPIILIGMKDREAMRRLMPKVLVGLGIGEANLLAQTEKRGDAEIVNYANMFAYGFIGDFIVISDTAGVRRVAEANENHQTLSSNTVYRSSRRWQPTRTLGQVYVSPALMEGYHEQIRKEAATLEPAMRDFLLSLNPKSEAITYALSNDGLGTNHELHLPKNLILTAVAGISSATKNPPPEANEMFAISVLQVIASNEQQYKAGSTNGPYGTMQELTDAKLFPFPPQELDRFGYKFEITVMGDQFEAVATPKEYGKTGKRSFFVDKSGVVRGGDHGGGAATIADKPVEP
ncbi:MAG TPA: hypothetical protein VFU37_16950 [Pyrinomonadaceae bacterium]|nr:hypothetical protein [Pyrinomonadaceae bacterium]